MGDLPVMKLHKWLLVIFFSFLSILPRLFYLDIPFERDEGAYAYISDVIDKGGVPYKDAFDNKTPGIYYLYNLSFKVFGHSVGSPRLLAALFVMVSCIFSFLFVYKITVNYLAGVFSMALWGIASSSPAYQGFNSNTEIFIVPFLIGGSLLLLKDEPLPLTYLTAGLVFGSAFMIKQSVAPIALAAFLCSIFRYFKAFQKVVLSSFCYILGFLLPLAAFVIYFTLKEGYHELWVGAFGYNFIYLSGPSSIKDMNRFVSIMQRIIRIDYITWAAGTAGIVAFVALAKKNYHKKFFLSLLAGAIATVGIGKAFYPHYFLFIIPFMAIGVGLGAAQLLKRGIKKVSYCLFLSVFFITLIMNIKYLRMPPKDILEVSYGGIMPFYQSVSIGNYLKSQTNSISSTVYIIGSEAQILFYAGLKSPVRFFYFYPLVMPTMFRDSFREETLSALRNNMPDYLILVNNPTSHLIASADPFLISLSQLFYQYKLVAVSNSESGKIIHNIDSLDNTWLIRDIGNVLIFSRTEESASNDHLDFGPLFESHLQAASVRSMMERYLSSP